MPRTVFFFKVIYSWQTVMHKLNKFHVILDTYMDVKKSKIKHIKSEYIVLEIHEDL